MILLFKLRHFNLFIKRGNISPIYLDKVSKMGYYLNVKSGNVISDMILCLAFAGKEMFQMEKKRIYCGWGRRNITPPQPSPLQGQFHVRIPTHTNDPLYATAFAVCTEGELPVVWCSADIVEIVGSTLDEITAEIQKFIPDFTRDRLIVGTIHTHTGPGLFANAMNECWGEAFEVETPEGCMPPDEYRVKFFVPLVAAACVEAIEKLAPSGVASELGHAVLGHPRRVTYRDGSSVMYGNTNEYGFDCFEGCNDNSVEMLYTFNEKDELSGAILNFHCPAQVLEMQEYYSADFVGYFRMQLEALLGYELPVLPIIGDAGNIAPRDLVRRNRGEPDMHEIPGAKELGRRLCVCFAEHVDHASQNICHEVEFAHKFDILQLPLRTVTETEYREAKAAYDAILERVGGVEALRNSDAGTRMDSSWHAGVVNRYKRQQESTLCDTPVHALRIGDCAFVTNPFELYIEYGLRTRARSKAIHTFTAELTDGCLAYLPTPVAVASKSYSAMVSNCVASCEAGELLTEISIRMINDMFDEEDAEQ